jgi:hypothetical protein
MHRHNSILSLIAAAGLLAAQPLHADDDAKKIAIGAAALLGTAVLVHQHHHHKEKEHHKEVEKEAAFERGYHDGLYNASYHPGSSHKSSYSEGYEAGVYERNHRVRHNRDHEWESERHGAPKVAMRACIGEVSESADIDSRDITPVRSTSGGGGNYLVEVASGYLHFTCTVDADGDVRGMRNGKI